MRTSISFTLNGKKCTTDTPSTSRLIDVLRDELAATSAKKACGVGRCGACMVMVNRVPKNACLLMMWQVEGADVVTPEGLDVFCDAVYVRQGLVEENAFQCGYCAPGFTVTLTALLHELPEPTEMDIREALSGNLCRCTGYQSIIRGALRAAELKAMDRDIPGLESPA